MNVILVGFMGCGKTTFGKWLSDRCQMEFIDTDEYIEKSEGISVSDIFANKGEAYFRDLETSTIKELIKTKESSVVSVGGGLPVREENRELLHRLGKVVFLDTSIDELVRRLENDDTRPLLRGGDLREKITSLMEKRLDIYEDVADVIIDTDNLSFNEMLEEIRKYWS